jgi:RNA polymerase sigma-70 factor (ECF subfamily)
MAADRMSARSREPVPAPGAAESATAGDEATTVVERDALRRALASLPPDHALAVHLRLVEGYPFADVARVMGRSVGACQMLVLRAGRELREALEGEGIHAPR